MQEDNRFLSKNIKKKILDYKKNKKKHKLWLSQELDSKRSICMAAIY